MADGEVKIDTKLDNSGLEKGLKDMKNKLDGAGKTIDAGAKKGKGFADNLKAISTGAVAAAGTVAGVAVAVKKTVDALNDCAAAYRVQQNAEEALQVAAKNNPYLDDESVYNLRNFASELQSLSEIGDEVSLQVMSQLAATGRNEEQIMSIMSAAADMAAVTGNSIQNVALQLNKTYSGLAGELGEANGAIRALTKEELENGRAIELVAKQYKGVAAATADVEVQLSNAWGDFKENIGRGWQNVTQPVKQFFLDVVYNINEATAKTNAIKDASGKRNDGTATAADTKILLTDAQKQVENTQKEINSTIELLNDEEKLAEKIREARGYLSKATFQKALTDLQKRYEKEIQTVNQLTDEYNALSESEKKAADAAAAQATAEERAAAARKRDEAATEWINANTKALQEQIKAMQLKASVEGENVKAGEMYNAYLQSYIDLITKSNGLVTESNQAAKNRLATLQEWAKKAADAATEEERLAAAQKAQTEAEKLLEEIKGTTGNTYIDEYKKRNDELTKLSEDLKNNEVLDEQQKTDAMLAIDEAYAQNKKNLWANIAADINGYTEQTADIAQKFGDLMLKNVQTETDLELAKLDEKYEKGEMSEEQYYDKQKAIKRKAAQEEYKIQMFQWTASILAATANIAEGVSKAIAQGGSLITGALVGAAGAVQIASIIASKPVPPQFYAGGIIGGANGATYGSDNTYIHARTGEMVLNAHQQRSLWDMINGQDSRQQAGLNLTVNNTQANRVDADVREQDGEVFIDILDKHINKGFTDGTYDAGLAAMNTRQEGVRIL
uniref:Tail length tape measure protein n=1 Tax=Siphoviridae sp. ctzm5103 TaxID=2825750 RepID=A0A8S5TT93_9CAUD|nr:MAG TPA: tail length tape measure protein [Siphoviridae sp. ctzm5103]